MLSKEKKKKHLKYSIDGLFRKENSTNVISFLIFFMTKEWFFDVLKANFLSEVRLIQAKTPSSSSRINQILKQLVK